MIKSTLQIYFDDNLMKLHQFQDYEINVDINIIIKTNM